jgi:hypothetical protein
MLIALLLRASNITFDLPQGRGLEHLEVMRALELGMGKFNFERITKGGLFYVLFVEYGALYLILSILGIVRSSQDFALYYMDNPSVFWIIGRLTSVMFGTVSVVLLYYLGKKIYDYRTGVFASLLFAIYPIHVKFSHIICVDIPMVMFVLAAFYAIMAYYENRSLKNSIVAGLFIGLAVMNKFPAIILIFPLLLAHCWKRHEEGEGVAQWLDRRLLICLGVMVAVYVAGTPGLLAYPGKVLDTLAQISSGKTQLDAYSGKTPALWRLYGTHFFQTLGVPLFLFFVWGICQAMLKGAVAERCMAVFCILFYVGLSTSGFREWSNHYTLPIVPFGLLLATRVMFATSELLQRLHLHKTVAISILVIVSLIPLTRLNILQIQEFSTANTNTLAREWIEQNIPPRQKILLYGLPGLTYSQIVPIRDLSENLLKMADESEKTGNKVKATYLRMKAAKQEGIAYDLVALHTRRMIWESSSYYRAQGIDYIIVDTQYFDDEEEVQYSKEQNESRRNFYKSLKEDSLASLVKSFDPEELKLRGPKLEIYKIRG